MVALNASVVVFACVLGNGGCEGGWGAGVCGGSWRLRTMRYYNGVGLIFSLNALIGDPIY